jgi:hypothetical protein
VLKELNYTQINIIMSVEEIVMIQSEMLLDQAIEFFEFNVKGSYVGDKTPIWCEDMLYE